MLNFAAFLPHPPIIIPTIASPDDLKIIKKTISGMEKISQDFQSKKIDTIIIVSPHAQSNYSRMSINISPIFNGNFNMFGNFDTNLSFKNNLEFLKQVAKKLELKKFPFVLINNNILDHGCLVPLYYLTNNGKYNPKILPISYSALDNKNHFVFGKIIKEVIDESDENIAFISSGDLSHCLTKNAPCEYSPSGKIFDEKLISLIKEKNKEGIINMDKKLIQNARECGFRSLLILLGVLDNENWQPEIISYEGPFGVGYLICDALIS